MILTDPGSAFRDEEKVIQKWSLAGPKSGHLTKGLRPLTIFEGYRPPGLRNMWAYIYIIRNIKLGLVAYDYNFRIWGKVKRTEINKVSLIYMVIAGPRGQHSKTLFQTH